MTRPSRVRVGPYPFAIKWIPTGRWPHGDDCDGYTLPAACTISIRTAPVFVEQVYRAHLLHEILHAVYFATGLYAHPTAGRGTEEHTVGIMTPTLLAVLVDNPRVSAYLLGQTD